MDLATKFKIIRTTMSTLLTTNKYFISVSDKGAIPGSHLSIPVGSQQFGDCAKNNVDEEFYILHIIYARNSVWVPPTATRAAKPRTTGKFQRSRTFLCYNLYNFSLQKLSRQPWTILQWIPGEE